MTASSDVGVRRRALEIARPLIKPDESDPPEAVVQTLCFLLERGIWFKLSRNHEARSCRDAAHKRNRLGHQGIPLRDEMKSFFGRIPRPPDSDRQVEHAMAHCRGDRQMDMTAIAAAIGVNGTIGRLTHEELARFGSAYGLVNPFETLRPYELDGRFVRAPVLQIFDRDLLTALGTPGTVMTNAGNLTWGVELQAEDLVRGLRGTPGHSPLPVVADISVPDPGAPRRPPHLTGRRGISIITGNAPESGIALWSAINTQVRDLLGAENNGDVSMPPVHVVSLPEMGLTMELDDRAEVVWTTLEGVLRDLCAGDTALLAIACNTTQYFVERIRSICEPAGVGFVCLPEVVASWLVHRGVRDVAIVGIPFVADFSRGWSAYAGPFRDFAVERLDGRTFADLVDLAYRVKEEGATHGGLNNLRSILNRGVRSSHIVLALTELSVLIAQQRTPSKSGKTIVDPVALYAEALARQWLGLPFPPPPTGWSLSFTGLSHHGQRRNPQDPTRGLNEDALLLADTLVAGVDVAIDNIEPTIHQELRDIDRASGRARPLVSAVADGIGSSAAAARASRYVLSRLHDASRGLLDPDRVSALFADVAASLDRESVEKGDPEGRHRAATVAGFAFTLGESAHEDLEVVWFSVGDCLIIALEPATDPGSPPTVDLVCTPAAGPDDQPNDAVGGGGGALTIADTGLKRASTAAVLLLCTDGLPSSFGIPVGNRDLAQLLRDHPSLQPIWRDLVVGDRGPAADRAVLKALFDATTEQWSRHSASEPNYRADNVTIALVRASRGSVGAGSDEPSRIENDSTARPGTADQPPSTT